MMGCSSWARGGGRGTGGGGSASPRREGAARTGTWNSHPPSCACHRPHAAAAALGLTYRALFSFRLQRRPYEAFDLARGDGRGARRACLSSFVLGDDEQPAGADEGLQRGREDEGI